tara:strand:+ start:553 stop:873 length:321 start_codon:yes stop_codon:yes gene_type:complete
MKKLQNAINWQCRVFVNSESDPSTWMPNLIDQYLKKTEGLDGFEEIHTKTTGDGFIHIEGERISPEIISDEEWRLLMGGGEDGCQLTLINALRKIQAMDDPWAKDK